MTDSSSSTVRKGILVLGMHRSGTSALTGALQRLGVELGDDLLPANKDNVRGFWESRAAMEIDEALLSGEIDCAVHSMKDVPAELPAGTAIAAVTRCCGLIFLPRVRGRWSRSDRRGRRTL